MSELYTFCKIFQQKVFLFDFLPEKRAKSSQKPVFFQNLPGDWKNFAESIAEVGIKSNGFPVFGGGTLPPSLLIGNPGRQQAFCVDVIIKDDISLKELLINRIQLPKISFDIDSNTSSDHLFRIVHFRVLSFVDKIIRTTPSQEK